MWRSATVLPLFCRNSALSAASVDFSRQCFRAKNERRRRSSTRIERLQGVLHRGA